MDIEGADLTDAVDSRRKAEMANTIKLDITSVEPGQQVEVQLAPRASTPPPLLVE